MSRFPVPSPVTNLRGDVSGFGLYLEAEPQQAEPGEFVALFPSSADGYRAVLAAREAVSALGRIFDRRI